MEQMCLNINKKNYNVAVEKNQTLPYVLREELEPTAVKCGCNTGDCGACKVIIDGEVVNSYLVPARNAVDRTIETVEGLSDGIHLRPIRQVSIDMGVVQCGYCTPGMIMSAKVLLDKNPDPIEAEVRAGISNNPCRCTRHVKIVRAIQLATSRMQKEGKQRTELQTPKDGVISTDMSVRDAVLKVTGQFKHIGDMTLPHMLHAEVLFSPVARARIESIDTSQAEQLERVRTVMCWKNAPDILSNSCDEEIDGEKTERVFDSTVRYIGDKVAAVAAETAKIAEQALKLIRVEYEELPYCPEPEEALKEGAYPIHKDSNVIEEVVQEAGDIEKGMAEADYIYEDNLETPAIHHGAIETHTSLAVHESSDKLTVYTPSQDVFGHRTNLSQVFGLLMSRIRVVNPGIGGGFGGKIDMVTEPIMALLAVKTRRPIRLVYTRREDIPSSKDRHNMKLHLKTGMEKDGTIVAQEMNVIVNAGACAGGTMSIVWAMSGKYFKNHKIPNLRFHAVPVYTNTPVAGVMRGFGSPQEFFVQQYQLSRIAKDLGMDIIQLQLKNLVEPNGFDQRGGLPHGSPRPIDCVLKGMELSGYEEAIREQEDAADSRYRIGMDMAVAAHGNDISGVRPDITGVIIKVNEDGTTVMFTGVSDMGNGSVTTRTQVVSEILGIPMPHIECVQVGTDVMLWDMGNYSSRGTFASCSAALKIAGQVKTELLKEASGLLEMGESELGLKDQRVYCISRPDASAPLVEVIKYAKQAHGRDICCADTFASCAMAVSYGAHFTKAQVDMENGSVKVLDYTAVHDIDKALSPMGVEGQTEGAAQMGTGYAPTEGFILDDKGKIKNTTLKQYRMLSAQEMSPIRAELVEQIEQSGPFGAKSMGECSMVLVAAVVVNVVSNAVGKQAKRIPVRPAGAMKLIES